MGQDGMRLGILESLLMPLLTRRPMLHPNLHTAQELTSPLQDQRIHIWGDSILKTSGSEERAAKRARKDERLAEVARNEVIAAQGAANMRRWKDCLDFTEMTGVVLHDYWNSSPSKDEADAYLVVNQSDMTPGLAKPRIDPGVRNFITGVNQGELHRTKARSFVSTRGMARGCSRLRSCS